MKKLIFSFCLAMFAAALVAAPAPLSARDAGPPGVSPACKFLERAATHVGLKGLADVLSRLCYDGGDK